MNELITVEMVEKGICPDIVLDKFEQMRELEEWFSTYKYIFKAFAEKTGINKYETDYFRMNYIPDGEQTRADTKRLKEENIWVVDAESGELTEVNAYEYFKTKTPVKGHVVYKEKK